MKAASCSAGAAMTSSNPRLIPGKSVPGDLVTWEAPEVQTSGDRQDPEAELEALRKRAWDEAYQAGHAAGLAAADEQVAAQVDALTTVLNAFTRPMHELDRQVEDELLELVRAVARQLIRRELRTEPGEVIGVIRAGLDALPTAATNVVVTLHPEDAALVRERLQPSDGETPWKIQPDPILERGNCRITSETSHVDGRVETRLGRVIAGLFAEARNPESTGGD